MSAENGNMMDVFGIAMDVGSGYVKYMGLPPERLKTMRELHELDHKTLENSVKGIKTAVGPAMAGMIQPGHVPLTIEFDNSSFFVGQTAEIAIPPESRSKSLSTSWAFEMGNRALTYYIIERALSEHGYSPEGDAPIPIYLVTGIPQDFYSAQGENLRQSLRGVHRFKFKGKLWAVDIREVFVVPQAMGAYYYATTTMLSREEMEDRVGIIDIGTFTTDFCLSENLEYRGWASGGTTQGISDLHNQLRKILLSEFGTTYSDESIEKAFRNRKILLRGEMVSATEFVDRAIALVGEEIYKSIPAAWEKDNMRILLAGGGSQKHYLGDWFKKKIPHARMLENRPYNTIVLGYAIFGLSSLAAE